MYSIRKYSFDKAKKLGVKIEPSKKGNYKIDVFDSNGVYITSIGDRRYSDFPSFLESHGKEYANKRRLLYHARHKNDLKERGFLASNILW